MEPSFTHTPHPEPGRPSHPQPVRPKRRQHPPFNAAAQAKFLEFLANGNTVTSICAALDVAPGTVYAHRRANPQFRDRWDVAGEIYFDALEDRLARAVLNGDPADLSAVNAGRALLRRRAPSFGTGRAAGPHTHGAARI